MPIRHSLWRVGEIPKRLAEEALQTEELLGRMIVAAPEILSDQSMLVGRQEETGHGGRIHLLALAPDGTLILVELKRDRTPREVVAQALDYAAWVETLDATAVSRIYARFRPDSELSQDFQARFGSALDEATLNSTHQVVIVASTLDAASERISYTTDARTERNATTTAARQAAQDACEELHTRNPPATALPPCRARCSHPAGWQPTSAYPAQADKSRPDRR